MNILSSPDFLSAIYQTLLGAFLTICIYLSRKAYKWFITRNVRHFWKSFSEKKLTVIITEYPVAGNDRLSKIAKTAGAGWLISKGMALSLAHLLDFCENHVTKRNNINICGDRTGKLETANVIILGSPANNPYSSSMFSQLETMYDIPYKVVCREGGTPIEIHTSTGEIFIPEIKDGSGQDFALILKAKYQNTPPKWLLIISGCYMWGTKAASEALTETKILDIIAKKTKKSENIAFIIRTQIVNDSPIGPEIEIGNKQHIAPLNLKAKPTRLTTGQI